MLRLENLKYINEFRPLDLTYVTREIIIQEDLKKLKEWWPHYKWLKKNNVNCRHFKHFTEI